MEALKSGQHCPSGGNADPDSVLLGQAGVCVCVCVWQYRLMRRMNPVLMSTGSSPSVKMSVHPPEGTMEATVLMTEQNIPQSCPTCRDSVDLITLSRHKSVSL